MIVHKPVIVFVLSLVLTGFSACSPRALHEAEEVVRTADSLRAAGQMYDDSARLAQTYETLRSIPLPFRRRMSCEHSNRVGLGLGSLYAHACYHYGRLLREKDNPVAAMECFISASHARTRDYHILGRVYSNMGSICHLAGEYSLSYDMFEKSANMFLCNDDSTAYFYAINDMAFELAEQGKKDSCYSLITKINKAKDSVLTAYSYVSQARACLKVKQYDSVIYYAQLSQTHMLPLSSSTLLLAQGYSYIGRKDSATYYANIVIESTHSMYEINNAFYILTNDDNTKDNSAIREAAANRSDVQKLLEIRQGKLSQAVQLLEQDRNRKPDYRWLLAILVTLVIVGASIYTYVYRKRRQHTLLSQKVEDLTIQNREAETQHEKIINDFEKHKRTIADEIERNCHLIKQAKSFPKNIYWNKYNKMCSIVDKQYYLLAAKLHTKYKLTETETRLCVLTLLDCKYDQIADLLFRSRSSIGTLKIRVARKIGTTAKNLRMYLIENECIN